MKRPLWFRVQDVLWKVRITRKYGSIVYAARAYGFPIRDLLAMWREAVAAAEHPDPIFEEPMPDAAEFFSLCTDRRDDEADHYRCVNGCCVIIWHRGANVGGWGRAGCPCDSMDDPRGEKITNHG